MCCHSRQQAEQVKARLAGWLEPRGLAFNDAKTQIVPLSGGFDFLGFNFRRYPNGKLLIKPSATAIKRLRNRLAKEFRALRGANVAAVLAKIVPITRGWVAYYRTVVSARVFHALTEYLWKLTYKWACRSHPDKPKSWIVGRYYGKFNKFRNDRWVFGDRATGAYLPKPSWTDIVRHILVKGGASPDDPALAGYWAHRRQKVKPPLDSYTVRLLSRQDGRCTLCEENLLTRDQLPQSPEGWERWYLQVTRQAIKADYQKRRPSPRKSANHAADRKQRPIPATCVTESGSSRVRVRGPGRARPLAQRTEGARVLAGLRSGDGPLSVRVRPSSLKRDCGRRTTSTDGKCLVNVHAKSRLTLGPLRTLRSEDKGQAGACPDRTRAIPCNVRAVTIQQPSTATTPGSNKHDLSPTPSVSWDSGQPPSTVASSGRTGSRCGARRHDVRSRVR